jgi:hypothetical protein
MGDEAVFRRVLRWSKEKDEPMSTMASMEAKTINEREVH